MMISCCCSGCTSEGTVKVDSFRRGGRAVYMCGYHATRLQGYTVENDVFHGTDKVNPFTFSMELETSFSSAKARAELFQAGFIATSDCTVDVEYKSPIYNGLNAMTKQAVTIERLKNGHELGIDATCGTHTHVGHKTLINRETMGYIRRFYHSLFLPLCDAMQAKGDAVNALFFGRTFGGWAYIIDEHTNPEEHTNFINTQHDFTLEYRIVKFRNAKQYMQAVKFCRDVTEAACNNFVAHFNDEDFDKSRYETITEYRKHKAQVAAKKIVKIYEKYVNNIQEG